MYGEIMSNPAQQVKLGKLDFRVRLPSVWDTRSGLFGYNRTPFSSWLNSTFKSGLSRYERETPLTPYDRLKQDGSREPCLAICFTSCKRLTCPRIPRPILTLTGTWLSLIISKLQSLRLKTAEWKIQVWFAWVYDLDESSSCCFLNLKETSYSITCIWQM